MSSGLNRRLVHEMRIAIRKLEASIIELSDRASQRRDPVPKNKERVNEYLKWKKANDYLREKAEKVEAELGIARVEIASLRASLSLTGRSPPHKKVRSSGYVPTTGMGMGVETEREGSPHSSSVLLPDFLITAGKVMIDRGCSPMRVFYLPVVPPPSNGEARMTGTGAVSSENRDVTAMEQSLMEHIETLFTQRGSLQEDISRIRKNLDEPRKGSISTIADMRRDVLKTPATSGKKKKKKKKGKNATVEKISICPQTPQTSANAHVRRRVDSGTSAPVDGLWTEVVGRRSKRIARKESAQRAGLPSSALGDGNGEEGP